MEALGFLGSGFGLGPFSRGWGFWAFRTRPADKAENKYVLAVKLLGEWFMIFSELRGLECAVGQGLGQPL